MQVQHALQSLGNVVAAMRNCNAVTPVPDSNLTQARMLAYAGVCRAAPTTAALHTSAYASRMLAYAWQLLPQSDMHTLAWVSCFHNTRMADTHTQKHTRNTRMAETAY